ncbi:MAG: hypothetical protein ACK5RS_07045, partial [Acidobacteriota bacterium]
GMTDLSMTPSAIPTIRRLVRAIDVAKAREVAEEALKLTTPREVHTFLCAKMLEMGAQFMATGQA